MDRALNKSRFRSGASLPCITGFYSYYITGFYSYMYSVVYWTVLLQFTTVKFH